MLEILEEFPQELICHLEMLSDKYRLALVLTLLKKGEMTYSELYNHSEMPEMEFYDDLTKLIQSALIHQYYKEKEGKYGHLFYEVSSSGRKLIEKLYETV